MENFSVAYTEDSIANAKALLNSRNFYVDHNGSMYFSADTDVIKQVLQNITG